MGDIRPDDRPALRNPRRGQLGNYPNIVISVSDGTLTASLPSFAIAVSAVAGANPPTIGGSPPTQVTAGSTYDFVPTASDPAGNPLTFAAQNLPSWARFDSSSGELSGTPTTANVGSYPNIVISVSDGSLSASLPAFTINVSAAGNGPPTISGSAPAWAVVGTTYTFTPTASDPAGNALSFASTEPAVVGQLQYPHRPAERHARSGECGQLPNIMISVSDGTLSASLPAFSVTVATSGTVPPPVISWYSADDGHGWSGLQFHTVID